MRGGEPGEGYGKDKAHHALRTRAHKQLLLLLLPLLLFGLTACTFAASAGTPLPTPLPANAVPTVIALTARALASPTAAAATPLSAASPSPTAPPGAPTATPFPITLPTVTPTPQPTLPLPGTGYGVLQILYPGRDSRVVSPIRLRLAVQTGYTDAVRVELLGEDGRLIYRRLLRLSSNQPPHGLLTFALEIPFEVRGEAETARLQVLANDADGRPLFQNAIRLTLLTEGQPQINYRAADRSPILFQSPQPRQTIQGGQLVVVGKALRRADAVEALLIDGRGKVLLYRSAPLGTADADGYAPFTFHIPYKVNEALRVRLVVRENAITPPGVLYLNSLPLTLTP